MSLNDDALFTAAKGYIYIGNVGATKPTPSAIAAFDPDTGLGGSWINLGHTSRDELPEFGFDGGDTETKGTWQSEALKEVITDAAVDYVTFRLHQFDDLALELYYGQANSGTAVEGEFEVTSAGGAGIEKALTIVIVDGDAVIGLYARKTSIRREGPIELAVDEFSALPLRATFLKDGTNGLFSWISTDMDINPGS